MGLYQWKRVPMGLKGAPAYFQSIMQNDVLAGFMWIFLAVYLDDLIVFGQTEDELLANLRVLFQRLREKCITLNPRKCKIGMESIEYVGHTIDGSGLSYSPEKIAKVLQFPPPRFAKDLRSFIGLASYFSDKVENMQVELAPLRRIEETFRQTKHLVWDHEGKEQFEKIKLLINNHNKIFFYTKEHGGVYLFTDASDYGIGAYLCQQDADGREYPVAFLSEALSSVERRWTTIEKECYAIVRAFDKFEYLLRDVPFVLFTDHANLTYLNVPRSSKVLRWKLSIQEYDFSISHVEGHKNVVADSFSRLLNDYDMPDLSLDIASLSVIQASGTVIPDDKYELIRRVHNQLAGHRGVQRTVEYLRHQGHTWTEMRRHVGAFIQNCPLCQKLDTRSREHYSQPFTLAGYMPGKFLSMDTLEIQPDEEGYCHVLVIIDNFTRWVELAKLKSLTAQEAVDVINTYFNRHGRPDIVRSDNSTQFVNEQVRFVNKLWDIEHVTITPHSHEENGLVERANKEILRHLRGFVFDARIQHKWSKSLPFVERILNSTPSTVTGFTPVELTYGPSRDIDDFVLNPKPHLNEHVPDTVEEMFLLHERILEIARKRQTDSDTEHLLQVRGEPVHFPLGSYVLVEYPSSLGGKRPPNKLNTYKRGPLKVVDIVGNEYALQDCINKKIEQVHLSRIHPFRFDPNKVDPELIAFRDKNEFEVERIIDHSGDLSKSKTHWDFLVRWKDYPPEEDRWLPWKELRNNPHLHSYLNDNGLAKFIPKEHRNVIR
jgi:hypothetical protein